MQFGTAERRKADVAEGVALAIGHVATRRGNRFGLVAFGDGPLQVVRPRQGRVGLVGLLTALHRADESSGAATSLAEALVHAGAAARQRSIVVVVSDFRGPRDWRRPLLELAARHEVIAVEVVDPETGRQLRVDTRSARLRVRFALAAAEERREVARMLASLGVRHVVLSTSGDWLRSFAVFLRQRRR
jgi:uncharacterized protein (DUF58 family)